LSHLQKYYCKAQKSNQLPCPNLLLLCPCISCGLLLGPPFWEFNFSCLTFLVDTSALGQETHL
jgi:hypothetical protein